MGPLAIRPAEPIRENGYPFERVFTLTDFLDSTSGVITGGGFKRVRDSKIYCQRPKECPPELSPRKQGERANKIRLGKAEKESMVHKLMAVLVEAVAIGQASR